jgi:hypothetical protein
MTPSAYAPYHTVVSVRIVERKGTDMYDHNPYRPPESQVDENAGATPAPGFWKQTLLYAGIGFLFLVWIVCYALVTGSGAGFWVKVGVAMPFALSCLALAVHQQQREEVLSRRERGWIAVFLLPFAIGSSMLMVRFLDRVFMAVLAGS